MDFIIIYNYIKQIIYSSVITTGRKTALISYFFEGLSRWWEAMLSVFLFTVISILLIFFARFVFPNFMIIWSKIKTVQAFIRM